MYVERIAAEFHDTPPFVMAPGGPLRDLCLHARFIGPTIETMRRRLFALIAITWAPLAALTAACGMTVPFLTDIDVHARLLIAMPLLAVGEFIVVLRMRKIVEQFQIRELIAPADQNAFADAVRSAMRLRRSFVAELVMLGLAFWGGYWVWRSHAAMRVNMWYAGHDGASFRLTTPGLWYACISLPIYRFIILRWYFRLVLWYRFLWQVSRIRLQLNPLHSDRAGGLGFLSTSPFEFAPMLGAHTILLSSIIGNRILHEGATLPQFKREIAAFVIVLVLIVLIPLTFFVLQLSDTRRKGLWEFGALASRYVRDFQRKWQHATESQGEPLLGSGDIQSLADLTNSFEVVRTMGVVPFGRQTVIRLAIVIALPLLPLTFTIIPVDQIIDRALSMFV